MSLMLKRVAPPRGVASSACSRSMHGPSPLASPVRPSVCCRAAMPGRDDNVVAEDSDSAFLAKLTLASFVGGAAIKYGSLLPPFSQIPFGASPTIAELLVLAPPLVFAIMLVTRNVRSEADVSVEEP